ncbi:hypothetical protein ACPRNU_11505 [Chromobacterium vaccinii]|uniref:DUF4376 domain-containing protein n=1 Tax=Chromobacterium vaccinii TaxID=1108595 RepID=UPI003C75DD20
MAKYALVDGNGIVSNMVEWDGLSEWRPNDGLQVVQSDEAGVGWMYEGGVFSPPVVQEVQLTLAQARQMQLGHLQGYCQAAITAGFSSCALGEENRYGSQLTDQNNLLSALHGAEGQAASWTTPLWCSNGERWAFHPHSAGQLAQLNGDWLAYRSGLQTKYAELVALIQTATSVVQVQTVIWQ